MIAAYTPVKPERKYQFSFSICTMVTDMGEYTQMKNSFTENGFAECEYLVLENVGSNNFDAYSGIRRLLQEASGKYIIIVHQDVRCKDSMAHLELKLEELQKTDSLWARCGNAGANGYKNFIYNIENKGKIIRCKNLPARVSSLDENLLIVKNDSHLTVSADIKGFHFYGTDLCIIADFLGYHCYVIDFLVEHLSGGNIENMLQYQPEFIKQYGHKLRHRFIQTTCTKFELSHSRSRNKFLNSPFVFFWVKASNRIKNLFS